MVAASTIRPSCWGVARPFSCLLLGHWVKGLASHVPRYIFGLLIASSKRAGTDTLKDLVQGLGSLVRHFTFSTLKSLTLQLSAHFVIMMDLNYLNLVD